MVSSISKGDALEAAIFDLLRTEIHAGAFPVRKECCCLFRRKEYYSKDRESNIVFDIAIEVYFPRASTYSLLFLIECKNYGHPVPVDDVEEFFTKTQQVAAANSKAILIATNSFQTGALSFARSKGVGLARYYEPAELKWELRRSASASFGGFGGGEDVELDAALTLEAHHSTLFDLYLQSPQRRTCALWDFFEDLVIDAGLEKPALREIHNPRGRKTAAVPFLQRSQLESIAHAVLVETGYEEGRVSLEQLCRQHPATKDLTIVRCALPQPCDPNPPLGRIVFDPPRIDLFTSPELNPGRDRFTLAHELAHLLLGHGQYMRREWSDERDYQQRAPRIDVEFDVPRMEYQANYLASCMLMPRTSFVTDFLFELRRLDLYDKGFGHLYVDSQLCNVDHFMAVTGRLMKFYGASRTAVAIRLEGLGLLRDVRRSRPLSDAISMRKPDASPPCSPEEGDPLDEHPF